MLEEFKKFAMRGNAIDMAVGIIVGGAFSPIVKSFVDDLVMPPIGVLLGGVDFKDFYVVLKEGLDAKTGLPIPVPGGATLAQAQETGAVLVRYGSTINTVTSFMIVSFAVFLLVRTMNRLAASEKACAPAAPTTKDCPRCCSIIPIAARRCGHCTSDLG